MSDLRIPAPHCVNSPDRLVQRLVPSQSLNDPGEHSQIPKTFLPRLQTMPWKEALHHIAYASQWGMSCR